VDGPEQTHETVSGSAAAAAAARSSQEASSSSNNWEESEFPEMQLVLPPPTNSQIKSAEFVKSSVEVSQCPPPKYAEFAVIGRSNVGKSSLINLLTNRKSLAMVSKQPGAVYLAFVMNVLSRVPVSLDATLALWQQ
jgi:polynucleotide 5'-kinase involved in rRNA processing